MNPKLSKPLGDIFPSLGHLHGNDISSAWFFCVLQIDIGFDHDEAWVHAGRTLILQRHRLMIANFMNGLFNSHRHDVNCHDFHVVDVADITNFGCS